jgi:hypothetical protein
MYEIATERFAKEELAMRRIIASLFTTLDGVVEAPEQWHFPYFDEAMGAAVGALMRDELHLFVDPIAARKGKRLSDDGGGPAALPLTLLRCDRFTSCTS